MRSIVVSHLALTLTLLLLSVGGAETAHAADRATDVLIAFDTTSSMDDAINEAREEILAVVADIRSRYDDVRFGVAAVSDYDLQPDPEADPYGDSGDVPWRVAQALTADEQKVRDAIASLSAEGGGDSPEAYSRALHEANHDPAVGWRAGARRLVVVVADNVPHDDDLNEGISADDQCCHPFDTGRDPGRDAEFGTADDLNWQDVLEDLRKSDLPLYFVLFKGRSEYLPYWRNWAARTGGQAADTSEGSLDETLVDAIDAGATTCTRDGRTIGKLAVCADLIADGDSEGTFVATGDVRLAGNVSVGPGPVHLDREARTVRTLTQAPIGVVRADGTKPLVKARFTAYGVPKDDPVSGRTDMLPLQLLDPFQLVAPNVTPVGGRIGLKIAGLGLMPGLNWFVDPREGGGLVSGFTAPTLKAGAVSFKPKGALAFGIYGGDGLPVRVLGGSIKLGAKGGWKGMEPPSLELSYKQANAMLPMPDGKQVVAGPEGIWEAKGSVKILEKLTVDAAVTLAGRRFDGLVVGATFERSIPVPGAAGLALNQFRGGVTGLGGLIRRPKVISGSVGGGWIPLPKAGKEEKPKTGDRLGSSFLLVLKEAGFKYTSYHGMSMRDPWEFKLNGRVDLIDERLGKGTADLGFSSSPPRLFGKLNVDVGLSIANVNVNGLVVGNENHFTLRGEAVGRVLGRDLGRGAGIISDAGAGITGKLCALRFCKEIGFGTKWSKLVAFPPSVDLIGGDIDQYQTAFARARAAQATAAPSTVRELVVRKGDAILLVQAHGTPGAAPDVRLTGPDGKLAVVGEEALSQPLPASNGLAVAVIAPKPGRWKVDLGSARRATIEHAPELGSLRSLKVGPRTSRARRLGRRKARLSWRIKGRLPRGTRVLVYRSTTRRGLGRRIAVVRAGKRRVRIPARKLGRGRNRLTLIVRAEGLPVQRVSVRRPVVR